MRKQPKLALVLFYHAVIVALPSSTVDALSSSKTSPLSLLDSIAKAFQPSEPLSPDVEKKRLQLKQDLLDECRGAKKRPPRERIEKLIGELSPLSPTKETANSHRLQKNWKLEYTTEKEINLFVDWGISSSVSQMIDGALLENLIVFRRGGFLKVDGSLAITDESGIRSNFKFSEATLDLGRWGSFSVPPVGEGWFDTIYLDDDMRIDTNSRNDILICTAIDHK